MSKSEMYYVLCPDTPNPKPPYVHDSKEKAVAEAERLAIANPNRTFLVLLAIAEVKADVVPQTFWL